LSERPGFAGETAGNFLKAAKYYAPFVDLFLPAPDYPALPTFVDGRSSSATKALPV
jgi:hypothetical protein